jgi:hypothetical protein
VRSADAKNSNLKRENIRMRTFQILLGTSLALLASACANKISGATSIGNDTYIMTVKAKPSPFGVSSAIDMGKLIEEASASCTNRGLRFVLVDRQENPGSATRLGTGSVTFKCEK